MDQVHISFFKRSLLKTGKKNNGSLRVSTKQEYHTCKTIYFKKYTGLGDIQ